MEYSDKIRAEIKAHALAAYPQECCGFVVIFKGRQRYVKAANTNPNPCHFFNIREEDWLVAEAAGEVVSIVHSHPVTSELPSEEDVKGQHESGVEWLIYSVVNDAFHSFNDSEGIPLYGRNYSHGCIDCLSFVRDYYKQTYGIQITNYEREEDWWNKGQNLYLDLYEQEGFVVVDKADMREGDLLLLCMQSTIPNHGAIYLGGNRIGHHLQNRLSGVDIYGDFYRDRTSLVLRHKNNVEKD